ncbi:MAG TPA: gliding motility protein GldL [Prolixibacteraceae bacterium]|nr:gliding motility protein GldL [Prolixibacteraceae bacterium]
MNIGDFLHSKRWRLMQNYIYSWGASVVLIGALFKLEHLPGASVFLGVGLSIEAIIFFVSAFEPLMELPDWKIIYPQLRTGEESDRERERFAKVDDKFSLSSGGGQQRPGQSGGGGSAISTGGLSDTQLENLKDSFEKLSKAAIGIKDITNVVTVTDGFVKNLSDASESVGNVAAANKKVSSVMEESAGNLSAAYQQSAQAMKDSSVKFAGGIEKTVSDLNVTFSATAKELGDSSAKTARSFDESGKEFNKKINQSAEELVVSYKNMTTSLSNGFKGIEKSADKYSTNIEKLNKNLAAINTAYEIHLKGTTKVEDMVNNYSKGVGEIGALLNTSIEETKKFNQSTKAINENIQALNNIYGKMLGALNGKK